MKHSLSLACALVFSVGCGGDDDDSSGTGADGGPDAAAGSADASADAGDQPDGSLTTYAHQVVFPSCAPGDGPAVTVLLGSAVEEDACAVSIDAPSVNLEVWTRDIDAPITFSFAKGEANGSAEVCPGGEAPCLQYMTGSIHFETFDDTTGATGSWVLVGEGQDLNGAFEATWCEPKVPEPCG